MQVADLERRLGQLAGDDPVDVPTEAIRGRARAIRRRRRHVRAVGVALVIALNLGVLAIVAQRRDAPDQALSPVSATAASAPDATVIDAFDAIRADDAIDLTAALDAGVSPDATTIDELSLLMIAAFRGEPSLVAVLLAAGADLDAVSVRGDTALHIAAENGRSVVVGQLLAAGADPGWSMRADWWESPLAGAAAAGHVDIVDALLAAGADPNAVNSVGTPVLMRALDGPDPCPILVRIGRAGAIITNPTTGAVRDLGALDDDERRDLLCRVVDAGGDVADSAP